MKKFLAIVLAALMVLSAAAVLAEEAAEGPLTGTYTLFNETGENLVAVYIHPTDVEEKGENYADAWHGQSLTVNYTQPEGTESDHVIFEFVTESGYIGHFDNLAYEVAPITMLSEDAAAGATMIDFHVPVRTGSYTLYNSTGENLTGLYFYPNDGTDKGINLAPYFTDGMVVTYEAAADLHMVFEFVTEGGYVGHFDNLSIETAPINMLSEDAAAGATMIGWTAP